MAPESEVTQANGATGDPVKPAAEPVEPAVVPPFSDAPAPQEKVAETKPAEKVPEKEKVKVAKPAAKKPAAKPAPAKKAAPSASKPKAVKKAKPAKKVKKKKQPRKAAKTRPTKKSGIVRDGLAVARPVMKKIRRLQAKLTAKAGERVSLSDTVDRAVSKLLK